MTTNESKSSSASHEQVMTSHHSLAKSENVDLDAKSRENSSNSLQLARSLGFLLGGYLAKKSGKRN